MLSLFHEWQPALVVLACTTSDWLDAMTSAFSTYDTGKLARGREKERSLLRSYSRALRESLRVRGIYSDVRQFMFQFRDSIIPYIFWVGDFVVFAVIILTLAWSFFHSYKEKLTRLQSKLNIQQIILNIIILFILRWLFIQFWSHKLIVIQGVTPVATTLWISCQTFDVWQWWV